MKLTPLPSVEYLRAILDYDPSTGFLYWKKRPLEHFVSVRGWNRWNTRHAGARAFTAKSTSHYYHGSIDSKLYTSQRIIWKWMTGKDPACFIDHINRRRGDNRWKNLREAAHNQNFINRTTTVGISGVIGVRLKTNNTWEARIHKDKKYICLGHFKTKLAAKRARKKAERELYGAFSP